MRAHILSVGTELTTGQCVDTNSAWLSAELTRLGVDVIGHATVDDDQGRLAGAIRGAVERGDLTIITGGLGPTLDDLTREALAEAIGIPLERHPEAERQIREFFARWQRAMPESNLRQATLPRGCEVIPNPVGTAPGIAWMSSKQPASWLFALPGVPREMKPMFASHVVPRLTPLIGGGTTLIARLQCYGVSEARLGEALADLMIRGRNPLVGTTASEAVISVRILAHGRKDEAECLLAADVAEVRRRVGEFVFAEGDETLELVVGRLLVERGLTISTAESCTGGLIAARFTDVPGSSAYFVRGYVTYSNQAKVEVLGVETKLIEEHGAVSDEVARAMAEGCRRAAATDVAIGVTGIAGPTGGNPPEKPVGLVYIALADRTGVDSVRWLFGEHLTRAEIRDRACKMAMHMLRRRLLGVGKRNV